MNESISTSSDFNSFSIFNINSDVSSRNLLYSIIESGLLNQPSRKLSLINFTCTIKPLISFFEDELMA